MKLSFRSKLISGYAILLISVIVAAVYGYYTFVRTIEQKNKIRYNTDNLILSNKIYQYMSEANNAQNEFLLSFDQHYASFVIDRLNQIQVTAKKLQNLSKISKDPDQISITNAIVESASVYLETFRDIKESILRSGVTRNTGLRGRLLSEREKLDDVLTENQLQNLQILEQKNLSVYIDIDSQKYPDQLFKSITRNLKKTLGPAKYKDWQAYENSFHRLYFEGMNLKDLLSLMHLNIEMIEMFVVENVAYSEDELEKRFELTTVLEQKQRITSLMVAVISISAGLLVILGLGTKPLSLARLNQEKAAILEAIRDGLVAVNRDAKVTLINQRAKDLLGLKSDFIGKHILELFPHSRLPEVMKSGIAEYDQEQQRGKITVLTTRIPVTFQEKITGAIVCFRRKEELSKLAGKLTQVNAYIDALRANNHEFKNKLQTIQGMIQLGKIEDVLSYIEIVQASHQQQISLYVDQIKEPAISAILMGKYNRANELGISIFLDEQSRLNSLPRTIDQDGLVSIMGNLIQNAIDAVKDLKHMKRIIRLKVKEFPNSIYFSVSDNGPGIDQSIASQIFEQGFTTKRRNESETVEDFSGLEEDHLGMGLYIARNHVISMGGDIQFKSNQMTTFEVTIPLDEKVTG